jgi:hypothetical protein
MAACPRDGRFTSEIGHRQRILLGDLKYIFLSKKFLVTIEAALKNVSVSPARNADDDKDLFWLLTRQISSKWQKLSRLPECYFSLPTNSTA